MYILIRKFLHSCDKINLVAREHERKTRVRRFRRRFEDIVILHLKVFGCQGINVVYLVRANDHLGALMNNVINF